MPANPGEPEAGECLRADVTLEYRKVHGWMAKRGKLQQREEMGSRGKAAVWDISRDETVIGREKGVWGLKEQLEGMSEGPGCKGKTV